MLRTVRALKILELDQNERLRILGYLDYFSYIDGERYPRYGVHIGDC